MGFYFSLPFIFLFELQIRLSWNGVFKSTFSSWLKVLCYWNNFSNGPEEDVTNSFSKEITKQTNEQTNLGGKKNLLRGTWMS